MPRDLALLSIFVGLNNPCLELIFMVPKVFEPLKFDSIIFSKTTDETIKVTNNLVTMMGSGDSRYCIVNLNIPLSGQFLYLFQVFRILMII